MKIKVIGAGLAGCEAAYYLARQGFKVELFDIKPNSFTPAHKSANFGELVCSNSLKGSDPYSNACGLLKEEMRIIGSLMMEAAKYSKIPAGGALAVDRDKFSEYITDKIKAEQNITVISEEIKKVPSAPCIIATGPLTTEALSDDICALLGGENLHFYDASAPIVARDSVDMSCAFFGDRYGKGNGAEALRLAEKALAASPDNYEALALKGLLTAFAGAPEDGAAMIGKALEIYPGYTQGHYDMAMALKLGGHYSESIRHFQKVLEKDPRNAWSMYGIATNYSDMRDKAQALSWLRKAAALEPAVRETAAEQDHFFWLHGDTEFEAIIHP